MLIEATMIFRPTLLHCRLSLGVHKMNHSKSSRSASDNLFATHGRLLFVLLSLAVVVAIILLSGRTTNDQVVEDTRYSEELRQKQVLDDGNNTNSSHMADINESEPPSSIEAPYIGMSEAWIAKTLMGEPGYTEWIVGGNSYLFYLDDGYAWLVKTNDEKVCMIQYFQNGKLLGSTIETGSHAPLFP